MSFQINAISNAIEKAKAEAQQTIIDHILDNPNEPYESVAVRFGVSYPYLRQIARSAGFRRGKGVSEFDR